MSDGPTTRYAEPSDAATIAALHADSWRRHYRGAYSDAYLDGDLDRDRLALWTARLDLPDPSSVTVLAEEQGELLGFVHCLVAHDPRWGSLIENLHVRHDRHREGIGRRLISGAAKEVGRAAPREPLHLWVLQQNSRAQSFYRALGGACVEEGLCPPPGGLPGRLQGTPKRLRFLWHAPTDLF